MKVGSWVEDDERIGLIHALFDCLYELVRVLPPESARRLHPFLERRQREAHDSLARADQASRDDDRSYAMQWEARLAVYETLALAAAPAQEDDS